MLCKQCGREVPDQVKFCRYCGAQLVPIVAVPDSIPEPAPEPIPVPNVKKSRRWLIPVIAGSAILCVVAILLLSWLLPDKEPVGEDTMRRAAGSSGPASCSPALMRPSAAMLQATILS